MVSRTPVITETPTVLWELRRGGTRLRCSVRLTPLRAFHWQRR